MGGLNGVSTSKDEGTMLELEFLHEKLMGQFLPEKEKKKISKNRKSRNKRTKTIMSLKSWTFL